MLIAAAVVVWPILQRQKKLTLQSTVAVVFVIALSSGMYANIGTPDGQSAGSEMASVEEMVAGLAQRLQDNPDDRPAGRC